MRFLATTLTLLAAIPAAQAQEPPRPSFDCARASAPDEQAICGNGMLAQMDQAAALAYAAIPRSEARGAHEAVADFLAARHACGDDRLCILDQQANVLDTYNAMAGNKTPVPVPPWVGSARLTFFEGRGTQPTATLPTQVGQCARTRIASITDRFGGVLKAPAGGTDDFDPGSAVSYADSGHQVSYGFEPALAASAIGDAVLLCLVSIPQHCPKGDERGRFYSATNLRTKGSWIMPDAQHMCGGA